MGRYLSVKKGAEISIKSLGWVLIETLISPKIWLMTFSIFKALPRSLCKHNLISLN